MTVAKKSLGQNFLMHARTAARIADAAHLTSTDTALEIGPGTGMLTKELLARAGKVIAVEADDALVRELREKFQKEIGEGKLELIHADIREFSLHSLPPTYALVANIPYYITGEIIRTFLSSERQPSSMTLLVQKEVAERVARSKKESILSLSVKAYGVPKYLFTIPKGAFVPAPKVDSAVLQIMDISRKHFSLPGEENRFFELVKTAFTHKRKKIGGNLTGKVSLEAFDEAKIDPNARAEDLKLTDWLTLTKQSAA